MPITSLKDKQGNTTLHVAMTKGISTITKGMPVCLTLQDGYFVIRQRFSKNALIVLNCSQITKIQEICEKELIVKNTNAPGVASKSEPLFAVRSRIPNSKGNRSNFKDYIVITYQADSPKVIIFEEVIGTTIGAKEFIREVKEKANIVM